MDEPAGGFHFAEDPEPVALGGLDLVVVAGAGGAVVPPFGDDAFGSVAGGEGVVAAAPEEFAGGMIGLEGDGLGGFGGSEELGGAVGEEEGGGLCLGGALGTEGLEELGAFGDVGGAGAGFENARGPSG